MTTGDPLGELLEDFELYLEAGGKSNNTILMYMRTAKELSEFLGEKKTVDKVTHRNIQAFLVEMKNLPNRNTGKPRSPAYIRNMYGNLVALFKWLHEEERLIEANPMRRVTPPIVPERLVPIVEDQDMAKVLQASQGHLFNDKRDSAIIRILIDCGIRRGELCGLKLEDVSFNPNCLLVKGKYDKYRKVPFGAKTAIALRRYLRARSRHKFSHLEEVWLGKKGALGPDGVRALLIKRTGRADVKHVHPHQFRHSLANTWLRNNLPETDLMHIAGWTSRSMLQRYGASVAAERAQDAHRRAALGDRF